MDKTKAKVAVVLGVAFGPSDEFHIRINFSGEMLDIEEDFNRLSEYLFGASKFKIINLEKKSIEKRLYWKIGIWGN